MGDVGAGSSAPDELDKISSVAGFGAELGRLQKAFARRTGRAVSTQGLAKRIGTSKSSLYGYLRGDRLIPHDTLLSMLRELAIDYRGQYAKQLLATWNRLDRPPPVSTPSTLPLDIESFTGRATQLTTLDQLRRKSRTTATVTVVTISGVGGIGKTTLAVHWAHQRRNRFTDGCLYLDLRGFRPDDPLSPDEALAALLRRLGVPGSSIPVEPDERAVRYQQLLTSKRMLILLDNTFSSEQVTPLLPPGNSHCFVVITSRSTLDGLVAKHAAHHVTLDVLSRNEARELLTSRLEHRIVDKEGTAVADILHFCAGLPLAIAIVASLANTKPAITLADIAADVRELGADALETDDREASIKNILSWSYSKLPHDQAQLFALLAIAPGPDISVSAVASLANLSSITAKKLLQSLENASLVTQHAPGRYRMHDLVRLHARDELATTGREAAMRRVVDFYLHTAHRGEVLLFASPIPLSPPMGGTQPLPLENVEDALSWFDLEQVNLLAVQQAALEHKLYPAVWLLAWAMTTYHWRRSRRNEQVTVCEVALAAANALDDVEPRTRTHLHLGRALVQTGRHEEGLVHLRSAMTLAIARDCIADQAHIHMALSWSWGIRGEEEHALDNAMHALQMYESLDDERRTAEALNVIGWCAANLGRYNQAQGALPGALKLFRRHNVPAGEAAVLDAQGNLAFRTERFEEAIELYQHSINTFRVIGDVYAVANVLDRLAEAHAAVGEHKKASSTWEQSLQLYREQALDVEATRIQRRLDAHRREGEAAPTAHGQRSR
ncbi:ATP-binding protein [Actinophytocola sediminis]